VRTIRLLPLLTLLATAPLMAQTLSITTLAGSNTGGGIADGTGSAARFSAPRGLATDAAGNIYVADTGNHAIRKVSPSGAVSTLAGLPGVEGFADGNGSVARFRFPTGVAVDLVSGMIYVADKDNHVIRRVTPDGVVTTIAGQAGVSGAADEVGAAAKFSFPRGLVVGPNGDLYVADYANQTIRKVTPSGVVTTFAGANLVIGSADGPALTARFNRPSDITYDAGINTFYVADTGNHRIRAIGADGTVTTVAGSVAGYQDGNGAAARFNGPWGLDVASDGNIYVADHENDTIRRVTPQGGVTTVAGRVVDGNPSSGSEDGVGSDARFNFPSGIATAPNGHTLYVSDAFNFAIRTVALPSGSVSTLAGSKPQRGFTTGPRSIARLHFPNGVAADSQGNVYVAETNSIRKITPNGVTSTFAGEPGETGAIDGVGENARFQDPSGIAVGPDGSLYVTDPGNHTIRKISPSGVVTTLAGNGFAGPGYVDGPAAVARFASPWGIAVDSQNIVYVSELGNHTIRRIEPSGDVSTLAGRPNPGFFDATGTTSRFSYPSGIAVDGAGNVYVADWGNHVIRKVTPLGVTTTVAGGNANAPGSADGVGRDARFTNPSGVASDAAGNLYVSEYNHVIRYITSTAVVSTVAGLIGSPGNLNGTGSDARFNHPENLALLPSGQLLIADALNHAVRVGTPVTGIRRRVVRQ
jgi:sugar lactone lactonase YvrE